MPFQFIAKRSLRGPRRFLRPLPALLVILAMLGLVQPLAVQGDVVILKDGYAIHGKVAQESTVIIDPASGQPIPLPKLNGFYMVDDPVRRVIFSQHKVLDVDRKDIVEAADIVKLHYGVRFTRGIPIGPIAQIDSVTPWSDWRRHYFFTDEKNRRYKIEQRMYELTPRTVWVESVSYAWRPRYLTQELGPEIVRTLLSQHSDIKEKDGKPDAAKRLQVARFMMQAGWYDEAERDLNQLVIDLPNSKEKVDEARQTLQRLRNHKLVEDIERANQASRHGWTQEQLAAFPEKGAEERQLTKIRDLRTKYDAANKAMTQAQRLLKALPGQVAETGDRKLFDDIALTVGRELTIDTVDRLQNFTDLALLAERDLKNGQAPKHDAVELLSLAATGWLLGNASAETKADMAGRLWRSRQFVLEYQRTNDLRDRERLLAAYQKTGGVAFDELARMILYLPPPEPYPVPEPSKRSWWSAWWKTDRPGYQTRPTVIELATSRPNPQGQRSPYLIQLPPEYHHRRTYVLDPREGPRAGYPVLLVLHQGGEKPREMLDRWSELAYQHGFILVAVPWEKSLNTTYHYSSEEHSVVLDVLRDLRRRFLVDSDRVFLAGFGQGATMAYDVGLSHPDLFAGVIPIGGMPRLFTQAYRKNGKYLPFYVVACDLAVDCTKLNRNIFQDWVSTGHPSILVEYKGRPLEWFGGELPYVFDWMSRQKRSTPATGLGEFSTMGATDNSFYWLTTDSISDNFLNDPERFNTKRPAAFMEATILPEDNRINIRTVGIKQVTVWLRGRMIDFEKPATIIVNSQAKWQNQTIKPSLTTLLEDFYERGDRQRLFLARVDLKLYK